MEDDPALRRFVAMALDELDIELLQCPSVAQALAALDAEPVQLIVTDLMMPGASGFDLLRQLRDSPRLRGAARVVVLSAGLSPDVRTQLAAMDVWRLLGKPVSVGDLESCVREGLADDAEARIGEPLRALPDAELREDALDSDAEQAIHEYFEGDRELFEAYRSACLAQFPSDIAEGDAASASADLQSLRRTAHSLKSVLQTLGHSQWSAQARELEITSQSGALVPSRAQWLALRSHLARLAGEA